MMIPAGKAGLVIGKGGETIKQLQVYFMAFSIFRNQLEVCVGGVQHKQPEKSILLTVYEVLAF